MNHKDVKKMVNEVTDRRFLDKLDDFINESENTPSS
ncbi:hypothetical protein JOD82_001964 [Paenibacillus sp. 1182]|nr:hypothetical protein [Paenibacillus sp. 1182]